MPNADLVVAALINQQVVLESRFRVTAFNSCREAAVGCFDVSIAMVNTDDLNSVFAFHLIFLSKLRFLRTYLPSPPCALDSSDARQRIGSMGVSPLRFRPAFSRSIIVLPRRRRLTGCYLAFETCGCRSHKLVMAHGLPARVGENVSDE